MYTTLIVPLYVPSTKRLNKIACLWIIVSWYLEWLQLRLVSAPDPLDPLWVVVGGLGEGYIVLGGRSSSSLSAGGLLRLNISVEYRFWSALHKDGYVAYICCAGRGHTSVVHGGGPRRRPAGRRDGSAAGVRNTGRRGGSFDGVVVWVGGWLGGVGGGLVLRGVLWDGGVVRGSG